MLSKKKAQNGACKLTQLCAKENTNYFVFF